VEPSRCDTLKNLFFLKYEQHPNPVVVDVTAYFKNEWCNARLGNWCSGHALNCVINTNGLEATNKVIKDELTYRQLMPVMDFLQRCLVWLRREQSEKRSRS
jgi:transposase-like protein